MTICPGDLFIKTTLDIQSLWVIVELRGNGSWSIYCPATNKMSWEWVEFLENPEAWMKLA